jgi:hypothetical protein
MDIKHQVGPTFAFMTAQTLPWRLSTRCLNVSGRMASSSSCRAVARAVSGVGYWALEQSWCSMRFRSGVWAGQSISGTFLSTKHSLTYLALWQGALSCWYTQLSSPSWSSTVVSMRWLKMSFYPSAFTFPCSITRGPSPFHEKHPHPLMPSPNFTVGTKYAGRYCSAGICHTQTLPSDCHMV